MQVTLGKQLQAQLRHMISTAGSCSALQPAISRAAHVLEDLVQYGMAAAAVVAEQTTIVGEEMGELLDQGTEAYLPLLPPLP